MRTNRKTESLVHSAALGAEYAQRGTISRSDDPDEKRWLWYYEPDDEQWNSFQYGHAQGMQALRDKQKAGTS